MRGSCAGTQPLLLPTSLMGLRADWGAANPGRWKAQQQEPGCCIPVWGLGGGMGPQLLQRQHGSSEGALGLAVHSLPETPTQPEL